MPGEPRERDESFTATPPQRKRIFKRHEWHARPKLGAERDQPRPKRSRRHRVEGSKHGAGVGAPAAKSATDGNALGDLDAEVVRPSGGGLVGRRCPEGEVLLDRSELRAVAID